ncbi:MAG: hypothetical protein RBS05_03310 [Zoogloea oleivorans]|uniref:hypothetical protein n=1 Tax=Zoogloea oleivorans TaxID=1552750 RepID=UPI002A36B0CF|nr:hypothetical protein [Zoogloea oleivorans]MDY0034917.1 hypothetical protein [Zoogloea oleivorans]
MAKTNYSFEKRQRELEKKRKAEEKRMRKHDDRGASDDAADGQPAGDVEAPAPSGADSPATKPD